tara:strand:- start:9 stop:716 length:708 start_codon:yes stop_codon:yes gene_type:complete
MPLWLGFVVATINITASYLPSHEAQHSIFAMPGKKMRWVNELVGHVSPIPLVLPYKVLRATHIEHHKHANNPVLDPDYNLHAQTGWGAVWKSIQWRQPMPNGEQNPYITCLQRIGQENLILHTIVYRLIYLSILCGMALNGLAIEAALLWWLPWHIAIAYIHFYLAWAPHNPGCGTDRYSDTKSFKSIFGNIGSSGMQYHVIHHLYPRIPLFRTPRAYRQMKPILKAQGAKVDAI